MTSSSRCCGSWSTVAARWVRTTPGWSVQLHQLLLELIPAGRRRTLSARQAKALLATVRPRDAAGKARRRVAAELITDPERIYARKKADGKALMGAMRCVKRRLSDIVYQQMLNDAMRKKGDGPGRETGKRL